jgi:hypothetical protein
MVEIKNKLHPSGRPRPVMRLDFRRSIFYAERRAVVTPFLQGP